MLIQVYRIDENGFYLEPVLIEQNDVVEDENIVTVDPPEGLFLPRWSNGEWTEGLSEEEIAERMKPVELPPSDIDILGMQLAEKDIQIMELQTTVDTLGSQLVEKDIQLLEGKQEREALGQQMVDMELRIMTLEAMNNV